MQFSIHFCCWALLWGHDDGLALERFILASNVSPGSFLSLGSCGKKQHAVSHHYSFVQHLKVTITDQLIVSRGCQSHQLSL